MARNEGNIDRVLRVVIGAGLASLPFIGGAQLWEWAALAVGAVLIVTGIAGRCPAYSLLGIRTCSPKTS